MVERKPCPNVELNSEDCGCTYVSCERKRKCCECIRITWKEGSFQAACFHQKSKKPTTGRFKNSYPSTLVKLEYAKLKIQKMEGK